MPRDAGSGLLAHYQDVLLLAKFFAKSVPRSIAMANTDAGVLLPAAASPHLDLCPGVWPTGQCGSGSADGVRGAIGFSGRELPKKKPEPRGPARGVLK